MLEVIKEYKANVFELGNKTTYQLFEFNTKDEYLAFRKQWKAQYKLLSKLIRQLKMKRKQFVYKYSDKKKVIIGKNPLYYDGVDFFVSIYSKNAREMMELLDEAKIKAKQQYEANK